MISQVNSSAIRNAYASNFSENKEVSQKQVANISKQGDLSRIHELKENIASGEYKVDLLALSEKIADELL